MLKTGDILLAEFPYSNRSGSKRRPVVLINRFKEDLLVAYFTTEVAKYANEVTSALISQEDIIEGRIRSTSVIRVHKLAIIEARLCKWVARLGTKKIDEILRKLAAIATKAHFQSIHKSDSSFVPGKSRINYAGRVYDEKEMINLVDASLDFWLTSGRYDREFCEKLSAYLNTSDMPDVKSITVNSGSSANLLALSSLTSPKLGDLKLCEGDEVITVAAGFPTSIAPIVQNNLIPVFVDVELGNYNIDSGKIEEAISEKTKAVFLAHTLGIPFDLDKILELAEKYRLWLIEDNCDALGAEYTLKREYNLIRNKKVSGRGKNRNNGAYRHIKLLPCPSDNHGRRRRGLHFGY